MAFRSNHTPSPLYRLHHLLQSLLLSCIILVHGFRYHLPQQEITAPERLCFSGDGNKSTSTSSSSSSSNSWSISSGGATQTPFTCPTTPEDVASYPAVIMDPDGYVTIHIKDVRLRDDGRRRNGFHQSVEEGSVYKSDGKKHGHHDRYLQESIKSTKSTNDQSPSSDVNVNLNMDENLDKEKNDYSIPHHLQAYLVPLDSYSPNVLKSQCCYELETSPPDWIPKTPDGNIILPKECRYNPSNAHTHIHTNNYNDDNIDNNNDNDEKDEKNSIVAHDYRVNADRIRPLGYTSAPIQLNTPEDDPGIEIRTTLSPNKTGRYMVVISNCAAELTFTQSSLDPSSDRYEQITMAKGLKMILTNVDITFVSKFGELPLSMMGIIPFYGFLMVLYAFLSLLWWRQSFRKPPKYSHRSRLIPWWKRAFQTASSSSSSSTDVSTPMTLLGLQNAIRLLVFSQTGFSALAFSYYLYLNGTSVDVNVLYSGTAAALVNWGPWSIAVALAHFGTLLACQMVVTLATDGMWLIQSSIQPNTKKALVFMGIIWGVYFVSYGFLSLRQRRGYYSFFGMAWIGFLMMNVRRSLRHLRSLMIGQSTDQIIAVGGAIVAKRSMYRKILVAVGVYPVIFAISFLWTLSSRDSWAWVGYVLVDIYLFIMLLHASIIWMPRPMASQEFIKYAPLEVSIVNNDLDLWEESVEGDVFSDEIELDHTIGSKVI